MDAPEKIRVRVDYGLLGVTFAFFTFAFLPIFRELVKIWWNNEDYSHGFVVIPLAAYLLSRRGGVKFTRGKAGDVIGLLVVLIGYVLGLIGNLSAFRSLSYYGFLMGLWGVVAYLFGWRFFKEHLWELGVFVFLVPIPSNLYAEVTLPLQLVVTRAVHFMMEAGGIPIYREGNILYLPNASLEVINACSGLRSIMTIIVVAYVIGCLSSVTHVARLVILAASVPLAILTNVIRVSVLSVTFFHGNYALSDGVGHTLLGIGLFGVNVLALYVLEKGVAWLFGRKSLSSA